MAFTYSRPTSASFTTKGLLGYHYGPLDQKDLDVFYVEVEKGHDFFMISKKITRVYYVISGSGYFTIAGHRHDVGPGMLVEVPPKTEYCYSGRMTILGFGRPRWFRGNDRFTKWNPDVVDADSAYSVEEDSLLTRVVRWRMFGKSPVNAWLRFNGRAWKKLPESVTRLKLMRLYSRALHRMARAQDVRGQAFSTYFLRNRPELDLIGRLARQRKSVGPLRAAVLACSTGPEAYSVAWSIRSAKPGTELVMHAMDISRQAVDVAQQGEYSLGTANLTNTGVCELMTSSEVEELFDREADRISVKQWIRQGIEWHVGDAGDRNIPNMLGQQDIVVANNFLCHMTPGEAEHCLRNIARLVAPGGYLFVSGVDLDVRTKVARDLGWTPLTELREEIHAGDPGMRGFWPWHYAGVEPLDKAQPDWEVRYCAAFRLGNSRDKSEIGGHGNEVDHNVRESYPVAQ